MTTLQDVAELLLNSDRVRVVKDKKDIYVGWLANFVNAHGIEGEGTIYQRYKNNRVIRLAAVSEIKHKQWKELNLSSPLESNETPDYSFSDLEMKLYYTIYI